MKDGTIKYGEISGSSIIRDGKIIGMISAASDVTRGKRAEDALLENEAKYRGILENINDSLYSEIDLN